MKHVIVIETVDKLKPKNLPNRFQAAAITVMDALTKKHEGECTIQTRFYVDSAVTAIHELYSLPDCRKENAGFICGMWRKRKEGPMDERRVMINRCDLPHRHEGRHCDQVILVSWDDDECDPESRPRNEWNEIIRRREA